MQIQPLDEIGGLLAGAIDQIARANFLRQRNDEEIEQQFALRRQKPGIAAFSLGNIQHAIGDEPLQKTRGVGARHFDDAAIVQETYSTRSFKPSTFVLPLCR